MPKKKIDPSFGELVRNARIKNKKTVLELAFLSGLTTQGIYAIEKGRQGCRLETAMKLARALVIKSIPVTK